MIRELQILVVASLLPALAYLVILILALLFGVPDPARWLASALSGTRSIPLLWLIVLGGPLLSAIGSLILGTGRPTDRKLDRICGGVAMVLLVLNLVSCVPFPFILALE